MKIVSPFKDYYDCGQKYDQDRTVVWVRNKEEIRVDARTKYPFPRCDASANRYHYWRCSDDQLKCTEYIVGFCGKIYPVVRLKKDRNDDWTFCFNLDDVDAFIEGNYKKVEVQTYHLTDRKYRSHHNRRWFRHQRHVSFEKFFRACAEQQDKFEELFREHHTPVFVSDPRDMYKRELKCRLMTINASLRELGFVRVFDPHTAYQELSMYYGGVLGQPTMPMPQISDKDMLESKGFNKFSFRKDKQK